MPSLLRAIAATSIITADAHILSTRFQCWWIWEKERQNLWNQSFQIPFASSQTLLGRFLEHSWGFLLLRDQHFHFQNPQIAEVSDFQKSYHKLRQMVAVADEGRVMGNLARYVLNLQRVADSWTQCLSGLGTCWRRVVWSSFLLTLKQLTECRKYQVSVTVTNTGWVSLCDKHQVSVAGTDTWLV